VTQGVRIAVLEEGARFRARAARLRRYVNLNRKLPHALTASTAAMSGMPKMQFLHFSEEPLPAITRPGPERLGSGPKPTGALWACKRQAWRRWCVGERFNLHRLAVCNRAEVDMTRVLCVYDATQLFAFARTFGCPDDPFGVQWDDVRAAGFDGFHIANRLVQRFRLDAGMSWLYTYDVGSICVWAPAQVLESRPVLKP
jgi:hypothetical protein